MLLILFSSPLSKSLITGIGEFLGINFPGASTQTPQGRLPPASQERGIRPNLALLGISLNDASIGECTLL